MSGQKDVPELVGQLEELSSQLQEESVSLEQRVKHVSRAHAIYRQIDRAFADPGFEVCALTAVPEGGLREEEFDWEALDSGSSR